MKKKLTVVVIIIFILTIFLFIKNQLDYDKQLILVCFGNSLSAGHGAIIPKVDDKDNSYPAFLQKKINYNIINAGVTGDTTEQGLARINEDVLSKNPHIVIIELGANDLFQGIPLAETMKNLQSIISLLNNNKRIIYLVKFYNEPIAREWLKMFQIDNNDDQTQIIHQYDDMFDSLIKQNEIILIEGIWEGVWGIHMSDEVHPNASGYEIMAENILKYLNMNIIK